MQLITANDLSRAIGTERFPVKGISNVLLKVLKLNEINELYQRNQQREGVDFIEHLLAEINVHIQFDEKELERIPKTGPFITISNHPFGAIDGLILLAMVAKVRPDFKIMANFLLTQIDQLKNYVFPVNPFNNKKGGNINGIKNALQHLKNGYPLGIFPAGEVSSFKNITSISDKEWSPSILKFIEKAKVPVVPIYFHGSNSMAFHLLGLINPYLRTAKLPSELMNKKNKSISVRIGKSISENEQQQFVNTHQVGRFLRAKTYSLGSTLDVQKFYRLQIPKKEKPIIAPISKLLIEYEIDSLTGNDFLFEYNDYNVYCTSTDKIPHTILEIGRLRELTFRKIGEGTLKAQDVDEFDIYYHHLFIWDKKNKEIVGGYRIGKGDEIFKQYGKKGFYLNSLFRFKKEFNPILKEAVELGRSFVTENYQKKAFPLFCLWKGILLFLSKHPEYRYLIGPVSISNQYSKLSKNLIIDFLKNNYFDEQKSDLIKPRKKHRVNYKSEDYTLFLESASNDFNKLDKIIEEIEQKRFKVPVLFKKYLEQNAKIIGFNKDPKFNNALDGLMLLDLNNLPSKTLETLSTDKTEYHQHIQRFFWKYFPNSSLFIQL